MIASELKFLSKDKAAMLGLLTALLLSILSITLGQRAVNIQHTQIAELQRMDIAEREVVLSEQSDWGSAAYYQYHLTWDAPSDFAFAAMGNRDDSPWKHRVRMLAVEGQIYESDVSNPDFALRGRLDFAFMITLVAPLFVIFLLFDLRSRERESGRLELLEASVGVAATLWQSRAGLKLAALYLAVIVPLLVGGMLEGTAAVTLLKAALACLAYLIFWAAIAWWISRSPEVGSRNLIILVGLWFLFGVVMPMVITQLSNRLVALPDGGEIIMTQREAVNDAWDLPKSATMQPFVETHPEWAEHTDIAKPFEWKWYYAFQQVGDQTAAPLSEAYRSGRQQRDQLAGRLSLISPASALQRYLERLAKTDNKAALEYETSVRDFHAALRNFYYPKLFRDEPFEKELGNTHPNYAQAQ